MRYVNTLAIIVVMFLFAGCWSSGPKIEKRQNQVVKEPKNKKETDNKKEEETKRPPQSNLIDTIIEEKVILDDTTPSTQTQEQIIKDTRPRIESVD